MCVDKIKCLESFKIFEILPKLHLGQVSKYNLKVEIVVQFLDFEIQVLNKKHIQSNTKIIIKYIQLPSVASNNNCQIGLVLTHFFFFSDKSTTKVVISHSKIQIDKSFNITWEQLQNQGHTSGLTNISRIPSKNYLETLMVDIDSILSFTISRSRNTEELFIKLETLHKFWNSNYGYLYLLSN